MSHDGKGIIFPTHSPVDVLGGKSDVEEPMGHEAHTAARILRKVSPLLEAREEADKVYSKGYFERAYPEADKKLKRLLHSKVMGAWANALNDDDYESAPGIGGGGVTIVINTGR